MPVVLGGILAGGVGFGASQYLGNDNWPFSRGPSAVERLAKEISARQARTDARLAEIEAGLAEQRDRLDQAAGAAAMAALAARLEEQAGAVARLRDRLGAVEQRLATLENRPVPPVAGDGAGIDPAALERQLEEMRQSLRSEIADAVARDLSGQIAALKAEQAQLAREKARVAAAKQAAAALVPLADLRVALDNGQPYDAALKALAAAGVALPEALAARAATGVPTLQILRESFPDAARAALREATRAQIEAGDTNPITAFLRSQLGARSLEPRPGDDPDAVLSRAEAALRMGDLVTALRELDSLPPAGKAKMAQWVADARTRQDAVAAFDALSAKLAQ